MQMRYAEPDFKNDRDDNDPDLIGFLRVEGSAMCEVSFYNIKFWKAYDTTKIFSMFDSFQMFDIFSQVHQGEGMEMITWSLTTLLYFLPAILLPYLFLR